jgi:hypothetical protein
MIPPRLKVRVNPEMLPPIERVGTHEQYAAKSGRRAVTMNRTLAARLIAALIKADHAKFARIIRTVNIKLEQ